MWSNKIPHYNTVFKQLSLHHPFICLFYLLRYSLSLTCTEQAVVTSDIYKSLSVVNHILYNVYCFSICTNEYFYSMEERQINYSYISTTFFYPSQKLTFDYFNNNCLKSINHTPYFVWSSNWDNSMVKSNDCMKDDWEKTENYITSESCTIFY